MAMKLVVSRLLVRRITPMFDTKSPDVNVAVVAMTQLEVTDVML